MAFSICPKCGERYFEIGHVSATTAGFGAATVQVLQCAKCGAILGVYHGTELERVEAEARQAKKAAGG